MKVAESFTTFLMFQPKNGSWVPAASINWSWSADAVYSASRGWSLISSSTSQAQEYQKSTPMPGYPQWSQYVGTHANCVPKQ